MALINHFSVDKCTFSMLGEKVLNLKLQLNYFINCFENQISLIYSINTLIAVYNTYVILNTRSVFIYQG